MTLFPETEEVDRETWRTWLAGQALGGLLSSYANPGYSPPDPGTMTREDADAVANDAVAIADALMRRLTVDGA